MNFDNLKIEILADGTIKTTSDVISPANHASAEAFLKEMSRLAGGATERKPRPDRKPHHHHHHEGEEHVHH